MILKLLSEIYRKIINYRNKKFDKANNLIKLQTPIISVGNLSVGGTGKTPFVRMLAEYLLNHNYNVAIVGRGYKKKTKGEIIVSNGLNILADVANAGDEMFLLAQLLKVPIIASEKKYKAAIEAERIFKPDIIIIDDGFQHRKLYRNMDIVILDKDTISNPNLIPLGRLREPISSIRRANIVVLSEFTNLDKKIKDLTNPKTITIKIKVINQEPYLLNNKEEKLNDNPIDNKLIAFAGIANPNRFFEMLVHNNYILFSKIEFGDHYNYKEIDIIKLCNQAKNNNINMLATTEKDYTKLLKFSSIFVENNIKCFIFPITYKIIEGENEFYKYIETIIQK